MFKYLLFIAVLFITCSSTGPQNDIYCKNIKMGRFLTGKSETGIS